LPALFWRSSRGELFSGQISIWHLSELFIPPFLLSTPCCSGWHFS